MPRIPDPPFWLDSEAVAFWRTLAPQVPDGTLDDESNRQEFGRLCDAHGGYMRCAVQVRGQEVIDRPVPRGMVRVKNPLLDAMRQYHGVIVELSKQFGLSPLNKVRLRKATLEDEMEPELDFS